MNKNKIIPHINTKSGTINSDAIVFPDTKPPQAEKRELSKGITILLEPTDVITKPGTYVSFSAVVQCTKPRFQWFNMFGYPIPHKNSHKLDFFPVKEEDFGFYRLQITDEQTQRTELTRWTELREAQQKDKKEAPTVSYRDAAGESERGEKRPLLLQSPEGGLFSQGDTVRLTGHFAFATAYQWFKDGAKLEGCEGNNLTISSAYQANTGEYVLAAYNGSQYETSGVAKVIIY